MPNWCENKLDFYCPANQLDNLKNKLFSKTDEGNLCLDFTKLKPMPTELDIECSSMGTKSRQLLEEFQYQLFSLELMEKYLPPSQVNRIYTLATQQMWSLSQFVEWLQANPNEQTVLGLDLALGQQYIDNLVKYGAETWYDWHYQRWGCKWNATTYGITESDGHITCYFDTPWSPPREWFATLCETFPTIDFTLSFFEPGWWFAGDFIADMSGNFYENHIDDDEIKTFAKEVFGEEFDDEDDEHM